MKIQLELDSPITQLSGVGEKTRELLKQLDVETIQDLLFHLPARYQDRTRITPISALREGSQALIEGAIRSVAVSRGQRPSLLCELSDGIGRIYLRFFHFTAAQKNQFVPGTHLRCFGEIRRAFARLGFEMIHPEYRLLHEAHEMRIDQHLTPIYPATQGLTQPLLRKLIDQALQMIQRSHQPLEILPQSVLAQFHYPDLISALLYVHRPPPDADVDLLLRGEHPMQRRLAFEELIAHQMSLQQSRLKARQQNAIPLQNADHLRQALVQQLGFELTNAQRRVISEIDQDLSQSQPMLRLLQGDVGSGKTAVAAMALLRAVANKAQAALAAPTELLAEQHFQHFSRWFGPLGIQMGFLSGKQTASERSLILTQIADGTMQIIIGTHALFQEKIRYANLVLVIIDEQHRFGVNQRLALREKGEIFGGQPHQLIMSATPIPRTLAMAAYADLDVSVIDELPPGRKPIVTALISSQRRNEVIERVRLACGAHKQVYWVCTLITESEVLQCQTAEKTAEELQKLLPEIKIALVHSRISAEEKTEKMAAFKRGDVDLP